MKVPIFLMVLCELNEGSDKGLIHPFVQAIGLGMINTADSMLHPCVLEEAFSDIVHELATLI